MVRSLLSPVPNDTLFNIPKNLSDYVKTYENHISLDLCKSAVDSLKDVNWSTHEYYDVSKDTYVSYDNELLVYRNDIPEREEINKQIWFALERYILKDFSDFFRWFSGWEGYSSVRFNRYDPNSVMRLHCDHIHSVFDGNRKGIPILTVLGGLNDDYEGGELMMFGDQRINIHAGSVVVFPSNFMFPHEVKPVKSGVRYSYVSWTW